jgi:hypothetical protein
MWEDSPPSRGKDGQALADFGAIAAYVGEAVHCLTKLYEGLVPDDEELTLAIRILGSMDRELTTFDLSRAWWGHYVSRIPVIEVPQQHTFADWRAGIVDHAVEIVRDIFLRFSWPDPSVDAVRKIIVDMLARKF